MSVLQGYISAVAEDPVIVHALTGLADGELMRAAVPESAILPITAAVANAGKQVVLLVASDRTAEEYAVSLADSFPESQIAVFPAWETLPHERLSPSSDTIGRRLTVLRRLAHPNEQPIRLLVVPVRSAIQPFVKGLGDLAPIAISTGDEFPMEKLVRELVRLGFERAELVERRGEFAVRGGIIDIFPAGNDHPLRLEYWGDTVEEIRAFSVADQRSLPEPVTQLWATGCRELLLTDEVRSRAAKLAQTHPELGEILERLAQGSYVEGMESLIPVLVDELTMLFEQLDESWVVIEATPERVDARAAELVETGKEFLEASWANATLGNTAPIDLGASGFRDYRDLREAQSFRGWLALSQLAGFDDLKPAFEPIDEYRGALEKVVPNIKAWWSTGHTVAVSMVGHGGAERMVQAFGELDVPARLVDELPKIGQPGLLYVIASSLPKGLVTANYVLLTEIDLFGQSDAHSTKRSMPSRRRAALDPLSLKPGDYVVHEQHGVGKYIEVASRTAGGATREYLVLEYASSKRGAPSDRLFVPTDQLDSVTKYIGGEAPALHRLGGADWAKSKAKARKAVRQIAGELIRLYAARMSSKGYAFGADTPWQRELEDSFEYTETIDQLSTINEVKEDMEREVPMDRLVCGDVGYGKTEIAVRAAFKAIQDGKQVALLVPTTLLVQQHLATFSRRYAAFPIKVAALSRFQTTSEAKAVIEGIVDGSIDLVIGTHRLFSPEVRFKDLGLVIVDEEQRFGVEHKEHLKALRTNVDMLTMSATPIPRTLELAVTGLREMSTIQTPPEDRHPVLTSVGPYDEKQIAAAIHRELIRDGQVFFVHNRVESINRVASKISELVPQARVAVAHGQMNEHQLEDIIVDFWQKKYDVLVATTIIESGLDIPNANTLIVDRAENFGLSQLHQIRGRVGRGRERGYAYFFYAADRPLSETAHDRLSTIAAHTELGAGMAVAMKDLEIRGAGNLLGGEQSGHIADVGFDLYVRMVGQAVAEVRNGGAVEEATPIRIELPIDAHLPHDYIREERLRLQSYRSLANATTNEQIVEVVTELVDRFGALPPAVENLVEVARLRLDLAAVGITEAIGAGNTLRLSPVALADSRAMRLSRLYPGSINKAAARTIVVPRPRGEHDVLEWVRTLIKTVLVD